MCLLFFTVFCLWNLVSWSMIEKGRKEGLPAGEKCGWGRNMTARERERERRVRNRRRKRREALRDWGRDETLSQRKKRRRRRENFSNFFQQLLQLVASIQAYTGKDEDIFSLSVSSSFSLTECMNKWINLNLYLIQLFWWWLQKMYSNVFDFGYNFYR